MLMVRQPLDTDHSTGASWPVLICAPGADVTSPGALLPTSSLANEMTDMLWVLISPRKAWDTVSPTYVPLPPCLGFSIFLQSLNQLDEK